MPKKNRFELGEMPRKSPNFFQEKNLRSHWGIFKDPAPRVMRVFHMRLFLRTSIFWLLGMLSTQAAEGHKGLSTYAEEIFSFGPLVVTNSMIMVWIVVLFIVLVAQLATRDMKLIPSGLQNFAEWLVESLYNFLEGILGKHLVKRTFWFFATIFILILSSNWFGLIPGVGTISYGGKPILRGANADLNMTAAMAVTFASLWFYWAISENGLKGFLAHIFAPKGRFGGIMKFFMIIVFTFVGLLEVVSILFRPVALSFRLYGNIFAGENILESMMHIVGDKTYLAWLPPLPFYFMEMLVGLIQALVFMLLTAVFLKLICDHGDHHEEEHPH